MNYTYDSMGRMLTRDDGTDLTQFTWDGADIVREVTGESETVYHIPEGQILSFIRDGVTYQAHSCALGSIRMITDEAGDVVARYDFGAFGSELPGSFDSIPGGMPYKFIGSLGCRTDLTTSLVYMRARWYAPTLTRFISKDPIGLQGGQNFYVYCLDNPVLLVDPSGLLVTSSDAYLQRLINEMQTDPTVSHWFNRLSNQKVVMKSFRNRMSQYNPNTFEVEISDRIQAIQNCPGKDLFVKLYILHELIHAVQHQRRHPNFGQPNWMKDQASTISGIGNDKNPTFPRYVNLETEAWQVEVEYMREQMRRDPFKLSSDLSRIGQDPYIADELTQLQNMDSASSGKRGTFVNEVWKMYVSDYP